MIFHECIENTISSVFLTFYTGGECNLAVSTSICGRVDDVLLSTPSISSCKLDESSSRLEEPENTANTFQDFDDEKPDLLQMIVDDEIKQFL